MIKKLFVCDICNSQGMITINSSEVTTEEICHCPVCGSPLLTDDEYIDE